MASAVGDQVAGLTPAQVRERVARGDVNRVDAATSRSWAEIVRSNVLTRVSAIYLVLFVVVLSTGHLVDGLFGLLIVVNSTVGMVQEVRAKRTLDRLALLNRARVTVVRAAGEAVVDPAEVVVDDLVRLAAGDQVPVDGTLVDAAGLEVDESLLTGESEAVVPGTGDRLLSGSVVVAGSGCIRATGVGEAAYAARLAREASAFRRPSSELRSGIDQILRYVTWALVPVAVLTVVNQLWVNDQAPDDALRGMVAALVPMVPEGLVLMTAVAMAVGVIRLGRRQCLVQDLPAMESLARVDVVCFDKTGTLTEDGMRVRAVDALDPALPPAALDRVLATLGAAEARPNASLRAVLEHVGDAAPLATSDVVPFSSARRWAAVRSQDGATWVLGAPDVVLPGHPALERAAEESARGRRVLALARTADALPAAGLPDGLAPAALLVLDQRVRPEAGATLAYFARQDVEVKVVSGDSPVAVAAVAEQVGVPRAHDAVDARDLPADPEPLADAAERATVLGRVTPEQKRALVRALTARGRTVAMTGDGVNDVLALKDADVGVAMGNGSPAARAVARIVLLDSDFATLPHVVAEGRRVIANIERVATLFLSKTVYSVLLALVVALSGLPFPLLPRHVTLIAWFTIGIPAAVLALAPNQDRARPGFVRRVLTSAVPGGLGVAVAAYAAFLAARAVLGTGPDEHEAAATAAFLALVLVAFDVLVQVARPLRPWKLALVALMVAGMATAVLTPVGQRVFLLDPSDPRVLAVAAAAGVAGMVVRRVAVAVLLRAAPAQRA
ncbi:HAD-IC family P-type ATPase [Cellulomonas pakistanensis]|uniref:Cation-transporting ATPase E n=1 Tax=Cellulomonas pakistanensis TaxID=992287 RepID=A0A919P7H7_9CELL|nr:HAD-IC family P-type ATPase [Cellulomonas pakistanensis]GIG35789.1 putative cation-transporting ATPase E [Cellulomonas pakistanensis]